MGPASARARVARNHAQPHPVHNTICCSPIPAPQSFRSASVWLHAICTLVKHTMFNKIRSDVFNDKWTFRTLACACPSTCTRCVASLFRFNTHILHSTAEFRETFVLAGEMRETNPTNFTRFRAVQCENCELGCRIRRDARFV